ncbi:hypothetical protein ACXR2U_09350 [Jatrophihabitans sp. YIM 134969]
MRLNRLAQLAGPVSAIRPPIELNPATLLVVLKNGKADRIVRPGRRHRRVMALPMTGTLTGVVVSTAGHLVEVTVADVPTNSDFAVPAVEVQSVVRLAEDASADAELMRYIDRDAANIAEQLEPMVLTAVESLVRREFSRHTHEELHASNLVDLFLAGTPLLDGLFVLESVLHVSATWNEHFVTMFQSNAVKAAELNRIAQETEVETFAQQAELIKLPGARQIELERTRGELDVVKLQAAELGVSPEQIANPEMFAAKLATQADVLKTLIENGRSAGSEAVRQMVTGGAWNTQSLPTVSAGRRPEGGSAGANVLPAANAGTDDDVRTPDLMSDERLGEVWSQLGVADVVEGDAAAVRGGRAAVLVVTSDTAALEEVRARAEALTAELLRASVELTVIPYRRQLAPMIGQYLARRMVEHAQAVGRCRATAAGGLLRLGLPHAETPADGRALRRAINDPDQLILEPLTRLLPFDAIELSASA